jgi:uncharacterized repeat protein (TIGR01451 family)
MVIAAAGSAERADALAADSNAVVNLVEGLNFTPPDQPLVPNTETDPAAVSEEDKLKADYEAGLISQEAYEDTLAALREPERQGSNPTGVLAPPPGWLVLDNAGSGMFWDRSDLLGIANRTNGSGSSFAAEDTGRLFAWDTELWSPPIDLSFSFTATLGYESNFQDFAGNGDAWLDISINGGTTWNTLTYWTADHGPTFETVDLTPYVGNTVILRWRYACLATTSWYWHIDEVQVRDNRSTLLWEEFEPPPMPDLSTSYKEATPRIIPGTQITYQIVISNSGGALAQGVVMTDVIPAGTNYIPGSLSCSSGACWYDGTGGAVYWTGTVGPRGLVSIDPEAASLVLEDQETNATNLLQFGDSNASLDGTIPTAPKAPVGRSVLIDQVPNQTNGFYADRGCDSCGTGQQALAENFTLPGPAGIEQIVLWSGYHPGDVPSDPDNITVTFHTDAGGLPGPKIAMEANVPYTRTQTGVVLFGVHEWRHTLTLANPVTLSSGSYWVEIYNDTGSGTDDFFWETGNPDTVGNGLPGMVWSLSTPGSIWNFDGASELAVQLIGADNLITVTYAVDPVGASCGNPITNTAVISEPMLSSPVYVEATTEVWDVIALHEDFERPAFPPSGWRVVDNIGSGAPGSVFTDTDPGGRGNMTGGTGNFVIVDSDNAGSGVTIDTELRLPRIDLPLCAGSQLVFKSEYLNLSASDSADVDISLDSGSSWINLLHWNFDVIGPHTEYVDLTPFAGQTGVLIRFHYMDTGTSAWFWAIDDVQLVTCQRQGVFLEPDYQAQTACSGEIVSYDLSLENCTGGTDTFDLSSIGNNWLTWIEPISVALNHTEIATVTAYVESWCDVSPGSADLGTVLAQGTIATNTATIETAAILASDWASITNTPQGTRYHAVAFHDGALYQIGGETSWWIPVATVNRYDIAADTWAPVTSMLTPTYGMDAVTIGDLIYVPGGNVEKVNDPSLPGARLNWLQIYDPSADSWSRGADMPTALAYASAVALDGMVYVMGGVDENAVFTNTLYIYDPGTDNWSTGAVMSDTRAIAAAGAIGGRIYVAGGWAGGSTLRNSLEIYNPATDTWTQGPDLPDPSGGIAGWAPYGDGVKHNRFLLVINGGDISGAGWTCSQDGFVYDTVASDWSPLPQLPRCLYGSQGDGNGTDFWLISGRTNEGGWHMAVENEHLVQCPAVEPNLVIDAPDLDAVMLSDQSEIHGMSFANTGSCPLGFDILENSLGGFAGDSTPFFPAGNQPLGPIPELPVTLVSPEVKASTFPSEPENPEAVLWDQRLSVTNTNAYANQDFNSANDAFDIFIADDFTNAEPWAITTIYVPADLWNPGGDLTCANTLHWQIYADAGGVPAGDPWGGGAPPFWNLALPLTDPRVTLTTGSGGWLSDVSLNTRSPVILPAGTWWFVFYPQMDFPTCSQYGRQPSDTTNGNAAQVNNPGGSFFPPGWISVQDPSTWSLTQQDFAFRLEGEPFADIPWLTLDPISAALIPSEAITVEMTFDSTGMGPGDYFGGLLVFSNDPDTLTTTMSVTMTVFVSIYLPRILRP